MSRTVQNTERDNENPVLRELRTRRGSRVTGCGMTDSKDMQTKGLPGVSRLAQEFGEIGSKDRLDAFFMTWL